MIKRLKKKKAYLRKAPAETSTIPGDQKPYDKWKALEAMAALQLGRTPVMDAIITQARRILADREKK